MLNNSKNFYPVSEIRKLEQLAISTCNLNVATLMERAGKAAFRELKKRWPHARKIVVVCGKGNNAGDGYVVARLARAAGLSTTILTLASLDKLTGTTREMAHLCANAKIPMEPFAFEKMKSADVVVDALLGIGLSGEVHNGYKEVIAAINATKIPVLAVDIPSGLNADTGEILGDAICANLTVTFIAQKQGLFTADALDCCGTVACDDLDLPENVFQEITASGKLIDLTGLAQDFPARKHNVNKWDFGHVLVVGGDYGMSGAARMAAEAAARVGAGLVSIATRAEHAALLNLGRPELMSYGVENLRALDELLNRATIVVLGPGLGRSTWSKKMWQKVLSSNKPLVIDADGLNLLANDAKKITRHTNRVFTPHAKEAARLLGIDANVVQKNRFTTIRLLQENYGGVFVLKGAGTIIKGEEEKFNICTAGNAGMASGGMGDILSGIIAGLFAQNLTPFQAAEYGVALHAQAGDAAARDHGTRGLLATDLLPYISKLINFGPHVER